MNFKSKGLFISILILISLLLICHISNYLYSTKSKYNKKFNKNLNSFSNLALSIPNIPLETQYNKITYDKPLDPSVCNNINEAEIPCSIISSCSIKNPTITQYQLSESEWAVIYKAAYEDAGMEVLSRAMVEINSATKPTGINKSSILSWP